MLTGCGDPVIQLAEDHLKTKYICLLLSAALAYSQTQVDLRTQVKNVDFSKASSARPMPTGIALPATCQTGEMFFKTDAPPGQNVYGCAATNTWAPESGAGSGSGGGGGASAPGVPLQVDAAGPEMTIGSNCSVTGPCRVRMGSVVFSYLSPATATVTSGGGTAYVYVDTNGLLTVGIASAGSPALTCSGCLVLAGVTQFPAGTIPLATWLASGGAWSSTGSDGRAILSGPAGLIAGQNITLTGTGSSLTITAAGAGAPAGAGTELQYRDSNVLGAVASSSVSGNTILLGGAAPASTTQSLLGVGNAISGGNAGGTMLGINTPPGFGGDLVNLMANGIPALSVSASETSSRVQLRQGSGQSGDILRVVNGGGAVGTGITAEGAVRNLPLSAQPACNSAARGTFWHVQGGLNTADSVQVCAKDASNNYAWRILY